METITMSTILADITSFVTAAMGWLADVADFVVGNPLVLLFVLVPIIGLGIGLFRRMLNL